MESKRRTSAPKSVNRRESSSKSKGKKGQIAPLHNSKSRVNLEPAHAVIANARKKTGQNLVKKKIE